MEFQSCFLTRRSVRSYQDKAIPVPVLESLVNVARFAPSWANTKAVRYLCIVDPVKKSAVAQLTDSANRQYVESAPALFILTGLRGRSGMDRCGLDGVYYHTSKEWLMFDAGIAAQSLCLTAWDQGIATLIMGSFDGPAIRGLLELDEGCELIALISAGYPAEVPAIPRRNEVSDLLTLL